MTVPSEDSARRTGRRLIVVTAADERFARCLWQFLRQMERHGSLGPHAVVAYDLGLREWRAQLASRFPWAEFRDFDFAAYPPHVIRLRNYAWKPLIVAEVIQPGADDVLWLDSASLLHEPLAQIHRRVRQRPVLTLAGQATLADNCDPRVLAALAVPPPLREQRECAAGVVGFCTDSPLARALAAEWRDLALQPALADPPAPIPTHRFDQALLSILVHRRIHDRELDSAMDDIDISSPSPARWMTSRNKTPVTVPTWVDPLVRAGYKVTKTVDQLAWRLKRFKATRVNGLHRWPKEYFQVYVQAPGQTPRPITAPPWSYYADPFLWRSERETWLFVEEFKYLEHAGRIVALPLDAELRAGAPRVVELRGGAPGHRSFPFVFAHDGRRFLLPETSDRRCVDLFVEEEFPHRWRWHHRLLENVDAVDSTLSWHDGRWWLFTFAAIHVGAPRSLQVFHSPNLDGAPWTPHPVNAECREAGAPFSSGRAAGPWLRGADGTWLRPVQASTRYYGESVLLRRIERLNVDTLVEAPATGSEPAVALARAKPVHHLAATADGWLAFDVRRRVSYGQHLPWLSRWALRPDLRTAQVTV